MAEKKLDFLRFSPYSIKNYLTRKLSDNSSFTDQIYEGSNLAILVDLFSYMAGQMLYALNSAAAESMFSDTQYYENMNRLVKFLGYYPVTFTPSTCIFTIDPTTAEKSDDIIIPKYSAVQTSLVDVNGKSVYYSFNESYTVKNGKINEVILYNGRWKQYTTVYTASGLKYETFTLFGLKSDAESNQYVSGRHIDVYIKRVNSAEDEEIIPFKTITDDIFLNNNTKYESDGLNIYSSDNNSRVCSIRLNENKTYELKFGDGINGQMLKPGDQVYVFYLDSNGLDAVLQVGEFNGNIIPGNLITGLDDTFYFESILGVSDETIKNDSLSIVPQFKITNTSASTLASIEETVEDIRENAPKYYKLGNRLVTKSDYEFYMKNRFKNVIIDVKCHNNWDYISQFFGWLYNLGCNGNWTKFKSYSDTKSVSYVNGTQIVPEHRVDPYYYITDTKFLKYDYKLSDPADSNNVYLWARLENGSTIWKKSIKQDMMTIKTLTAETVCVDPISTVFTICAAPIERALEYFKFNTKFDPNVESYLEVTINDNTLFNNTTVKTQIIDTIVNYFKEKNMRLGQLVDNGVLTTRIYSISGIESVRTIFSPIGDDAKSRYTTKYLDGISFASWSTTLVDVGDDLQIGNVARKIEEFQFPSYYDISKLSSQILIIKKSFSSSQTIQY